MAIYKPWDDHWQTRLAAIEGRPEPEPVDACKFCGAGLDGEDEDEACRRCALREGMIDD